MAPACSAPLALSAASHSGLVRGTPDSAYATATSRGLGGRHQHDGRPGGAQHRFGDGATEEPAEPTAPVCAHDDDVDAAHTGGLHDRLRGAAVPDGADHARHAL